MTRDIVERGHEMGNHGYLHEIFDTIPFDEVKRVIVKGSDAIERVTGIGPRACAPRPATSTTGSRSSCSRRGSPTTRAAGTASSSLYWARGQDTLNDEGPNVFGEDIDLVEVPLSLMMQDLVYFEADFAVSAFQGRNAPSQVEEIWTEQFNYMYENVPGGVLNVTMHPQSIGWGLRVAMLERFIKHCLTTRARASPPARRSRRSSAPPRAASEPLAVTAKWLIPTIVYIFAGGGLGILSKVALRQLRWQDLVLWTGIGYVILATGS